MDELAEIPRLTRLSNGAQRSTDFPCPFAECEGEGWILGEDDVARRCRCWDKRVAVARSKGLAHTIPRKFQDVAFERRPVVGMHPDVIRTVKQFCRRFNENLEKGEGLWFWGPRGTGKTTLAMLVSKEALAAGHTVAIYTLPNLLTAIRDTYDNDREQGYSQLMRKLTSVELLHIEDMAIVENPRPWVLEQFYTVVNTRYEDQRSILFTADHQPEWSTLGDHIGERTYSRLYEMCGPPIPMFGEDQRRALGGQLGEERLLRDARGR